MSRKTNTVEWFPHYANASSKMTLTILEKKYGAEGYACWFKLLECLAQTEGHFIPCQTKTHLEYLTCKLPVSNGNLISMLQDMADLSAIDKELWDTNKIIWSDHFIQGIKEVYANRGRDLPNKPIIPQQPIPNLVPTYLREEEKEEKELEEEKGKGNNLKIIPITDYENVTMLEIEYQKLLTEFGNDGTKERIEKLSLYKKSKGKKYKDDYATILTWDRNDKKKQQNNNNPDKFTQGKYGNQVQT